MVEVRRAGAADAAELVRLRGIMLAAMRGHEPAPGPWQDNARRLAETRLAETAGPVAAFVVDAAHRPGALAACAVGSIEHRLGGPENPDGRVGYVYNVVTDPDYRRRGYSRACLTALLRWFAERDVPQVDLRASEAGLPLYRELGFRPSSMPGMRLTLPLRTAAASE